MPRALLFRLTPAGPWRNGTGPGNARGVDPICHSDTLYSALTQAVITLGRTPEVAAEWAEATMHDPGITVTSLFPFLREDLYAPPPRVLWPPPVSARLRAQGAQFVPTRVIGQLMAGQPLKEDSWEVDSMSRCLVPRSGRQGHTGPFRFASRESAAVDRLSGATHAHRSECLEFAPNAGYWGAAVFPDESSEKAWSPKIEAAIRLLADSGIGGRRSLGWGHSRTLEFQRGDLASMLFRREALVDGAAADAWWLLSLYSPNEADAVDWTLGNYSTVERSGRSQAGGLKTAMEMVAEGSVLAARGAPRGAAVEEAPQQIRFGRAASLPFSVSEAAS